MFNLSKDQSLRSLLSKVELDDETSALLKQDASPSEIKNSLLKNMDSSNIVKYRRYIQKAEEEEDRFKGLDEDEVEEIKAKEKEEEDRFKEEAGIDDSDASDEFSEDEKRQMEEQLEMDFASRDARKKQEFAVRRLNEFRKYVTDLKKYMASGSKRKAFDTIFNSIEYSNKVIAMLFESKRDRTFLEKKFARQIDSTIPEAKMVYAYRKDKPMTPDDDNVDANKSVSIELLQNEIYAFVELLDELSKMHSQKHGKTPVVLVNPTDELAAYNALRRYISGERKGITPRFQKMARKLERISAVNQTLREQAELMAENIETLEEIEKDVDSIIANKIKNLQNMTRGIMRRRLESQNKGEGSKYIDNELRRIMAEIKELQGLPKPDGKDKEEDKRRKEALEEVAEEERASLREHIEEEREKLFSMSVDSQFYVEYSELIRRVSKVVNSVQEKLDAGGKLMQSPTEILLEAYPVLLDMGKMSKEMVEVITVEAEEVRESLKKLMEGEVTEGFGFDGISQTSGEEVDSINRSNDKWKELNSKLEEIMNRYDAEVKRVNEVYRGD